MRGMGNLQGMMKQAQKMQKQMMEAQEALNKQEFVGKSEGDLVQVTMLGSQKVLSVSIKEEIVDPSDVEMLEDLIVSAVNDGLTQIKETSEKTLGRFTNGLNLPGM